MNNNFTEKIEAIVIAAENFLPKCEHTIFEPEMHDCGKVALWHTFGWEGEEYKYCDEHKDEHGDPDGSPDLHEEAFELRSTIENYKKYYNRAN